MIRPSRVTVSPLSRTAPVLHCACDGGEVVSVETASGRIVACVPIAGSPDVVFFNPRRERLYVAIAEPGVLQSIDTAAGRLLETIPTGRGARRSASMRSVSTCTP